jgi:hypothetical protein
VAYTYVPALLEQIIAVLCVSNASDGRVHENSGNDSGRSDGGAGAGAGAGGDCMLFFFNGVVFILL